MTFVERVSDFVKRSAVIRVILGFALAAGVLLLVGWLVTGPGRSYAGAIDAPIRSSIRQMQSPLWTSLFLTVTKLGSTLYLAVIGSVIGVAFLYLRMFWPFVIFVITMAGQAILHNGAKLLIARPRPSAMLSYPAIESFSFPSGHALSALCLYASAAWLATNRLENSALKAGIWMITLMLVFLIGLSRVYIGIHYSTDVLVGWIAAAIWTAAVVSTDHKQL